MIGIEGRQVVAMTAAKCGVLFEQAFLHIEAEGIRLVVGVALGDVADGETVDLAIPEQHLEQALALQLRGLGQ
ncbi:hypothetical protein D9M71_61560 [compost metagenome]